MTFMIILGAVAGVYLLWLMFRLATFALPAYAGIAVVLLLHDAAYGYAAAIAAGIAVGGGTWLIGQTSFALVRSPILRFGVAAIFAVPAGFAGYQLFHAVAELAGADGAVLLSASLAGAGATASAAWAGLSAREPSLAPHTQLAGNPPH